MKAPSWCRLAAIASWLNARIAQHPEEGATEGYRRRRRPRDGLHDRRVFPGRTPEVEEDVGPHDVVANSDQEETGRILGALLEIAPVHRGDIERGEFYLQASCRDSHCLQELEVAVRQAAARQSVSLGDLFGVGGLHGLEESGGDPFQVLKQRR